MISDCVGSGAYTSTLGIASLTPREVLDLGEEHSKIRRSSPIWELVKNTTVPKLYYNTLNPAISDSCDKNRETTTLYWALPGHGEITKIDRFDGCGNLRITEVCPSGDHVINYHYHCSKLSCPVCSEYTIYNSITRKKGILSKMRGFAEYRRNSNRPVTLYHMVLSAPPGDSQRYLGDADSYANFRRTAYRYAKQLGVIGGTAFLHPFRHPEKGSSEWRIGAHFHMLAFFDAPLSPEFYSEVERFNKRAGWVCKIVHAKDLPEDLRGFAPDLVGGMIDPESPALGGIATYLLSHVGVLEGEHSYFAFGSREYKSFGEKLKIKVVADKTPSSVVGCPNCTNALYDYSEIRRFLDGDSDCAVPLTEPVSVSVYSSLSEDDCWRTIYPEDEPKSHDTPELEFLKNPLFVLMDPEGRIIRPDSPEVSPGGLILFPRGRRAFPDLDLVMRPEDYRDSLWEGWGEGRRCPYSSAQTIMIRSICSPRG